MKIFVVFVICSALFTGFCGGFVFALMKFPPTVTNHPIIVKPCEPDQLSYK